MDIEFKEIDEQIEIIKNKNILVKDEETAKNTLLRENYYNLISGYQDIFIDIKKSKKSGIETCGFETYFEEIYAVYQFDRELRNLMLNYISIIETNIKSYISIVFSRKYGVKDYLKEENFDVNDKNRAKYKRLVKSINDNLERNIENYPDIKECQEKYGTVPIWMSTTLITFGSIVNFYTLMKEEDKKEVAGFLNVKYRDLKLYLKMLNTIRNISAHNNVLFNTKLDIAYPCKGESFYHKSLGIVQNGNTYESGINDIMAIIIILRRLLRRSEYIKFATELINAISEVKEELDSESFENFLEEMGIPNNYENLVNI